MDISFHEFLAWEAVATDAFLVRGAYVDIAGSFKSGALLGRIVYYYLPSKSGSANKLRVERNGVLWIAKTREQWQDEIHLTGKELDKALKQLIDRDIVEKKTFHFAGKPTLHVRLNIDTFLWHMEERLEERRQAYAATVAVSDTTEDKPEQDKQYDPDAPRCPECKSTRVVSEDSRGRCAYCFVRAGWAHYFPNKPQPKLGTDKYRKQATDRWKKSNFRENWQLALERASQSPTCNEESWFNFDFFTRNETNIDMMFEYCMSWKYEKIHDEVPRHDGMEGMGQM